VTGIELIHRTEGRVGGSPLVFGLTTPLLTTSTGEKIGKSANNADRVWLSSARTSDYHFYQYWMNTSDADVSRFLRLLTFMPLEEVEYLEQDHAKRPERRAAQQALAQEVTSMVRGAEAVESAERATRVFFGTESLQSLSCTQLEDILQDVPTLYLTKEKLFSLRVMDVIHMAGAAKSRTEAGRLVQRNAFQLNGNGLPDGQRHVSDADLMFGKHLVLRRSKKHYFLVSLVEDEPIENP